MKAAIVGKLRRARGEGEREDDHEHRRLRERGEHHLTAGADAAEAGADIERCDSVQEARRAEKGDDGDEVAEPSEGRPV